MARVRRPVALVVALLLLLGICSTASAEPISIIGGLITMFGAQAAGVVLAEVAFAGITYGALAFAAGSMLFGTIAAKRSARKAEQAARDQHNAGLQDRLVTSLSTASPWQIVYGQAEVGGSLEAILTSGAKDEFKHLVIVFAAHECEEIVDIKINGESIGALDGSGNVTTGKYHKDSTEVITETVAFNGSGQGTISHAGAILKAVVVPGLGPTDAWDGTPEEPFAATLTGTTVSGGPIGVSARVTYTTSDNTAMVRIQKHLGSDTQVADATLLAECPSSWTSNDRLRGLCYIVLRLNLNEPEFQGGPPGVTAVIKGKKVYDHRTATTAWSANAALCLVDFLMAPYGKDARSNQIVWSAADAAANACDETIPLVVGTGPRYTCNGAFNTSQGVDEVLEQLLSAMVGWADCSGGWRIGAGVWTAPVTTITDDDNCGPVQVISGAALDELFNGVRGQFSDPTRFAQATDFPPYRNAAYAAADGRDLWLDMSLPFTNEAQRATNIARIVNEQARGETLSYPAKLAIANRVRTGERFILYSPALGIAGATFRLTKREETPGGTFLLEMQQDVEANYDEADAVTPIAGSSNGLSDLYVVPTPTGLTADSGELYALITSTSVIPRVLVEVTGAPQYVTDLLQIEWRTSSTDTWQSLVVTPGQMAAYIENVNESVTYFVRARWWRPGVNAAGDWAVVAVTVTGKTTAPPAFDVFTVAELDTGTRTYTFAYTTTPPPVDWVGAEIRMQAGSHPTPTWSAMTPLADDGTFFTASPVESIAPASTGTWTFACRSRDSANLSTMKVAIVTFALVAEEVYVPDLTAPPTPTGMAVVADPTHVEISHDVPSYTVGHGHAKTLLYGVTGYEPAVATMTIASPCVVTLPFPAVNGMNISFSTTGALPTGLVAGTQYFIKLASGNTCRLSTTSGGASINTSGSQSGVHTATVQPVFANAAKLAEFTGNVASAPVTRGEKWHLWTKWQTVDGGLSTTPAGGTNGLIGSTLDLTAPPTPTGMAVVADPTHIEVSHDAPTYTAGHGHAKTLLYGVTGYQPMTATMTIASPCVVTLPVPPVDGMTISFSTTGVLPTGLVAGTQYFAKLSSGNTCRLATTVGGASINTSGSQSGVHTATLQPTFTHASQLAEFTGNVASYPVTKGEKWHAWTKWQSNDGVVSATPAGGTNGVVGSTLDLTAPPTPTGMALVADPTSIEVSHDAPTYTTGHGHDRTLLYGRTGYAPGTATMTIATPCVVTLPFPPVDDMTISFATTGALPTGLVAGTQYFAKLSSGNTCRLSATVGGASINTTGSQSGVHTATMQPTFTHAAKLTEFTGNVASFPVTKGEKWHAWTKWQSVDGVASATPAGGTNGVVASTLDPTAPPQPTGFSVQPGLTYAYVTHDVPSYTVGHGHDATVLYGALADAPAVATMTIASPCVVTLPFAPVNDKTISFSTTGALPTGLVAGTQYFVKNASGFTCNLSATVGGASINTSGSQSGVHTATMLPTFTHAAKLSEFTGNVFSQPVVPGSRWRLWVNWRSSDGVESATPAGGTNGQLAQAPLVGTSDLTDLIITAQKLADGSVTGPKLTVSSIVAGDGVIANGAILNALLGTAAVDTLKVAGNAITVPAFAQTTSDVTLTTSDQTLISVTINTGGVAPTAVLLIGAITTQPASGSPTNFEDCVFGFWRDSTLLQEGPASLQGDRYQVVAAQWTDTAVLSASTNYTYTLKGRRLGTPSAISPVVTASSITAMGAKR